MKPLDLSKVVYEGKCCVVVDVGDQLPNRGTRQMFDLEPEGALLHHTAGKTNRHGDKAVRATAMVHYKRKWLAIGYHLYIPYVPRLLRDKLVVYLCRPLDKEGAHAGASGNPTHLGIVLQGLFADGNEEGSFHPSPDQVIALDELWHDWLVAHLGLPIDSIKPHSSMAPGRHCPGWWGEQWCLDVAGNAYEEYEDDQEEENLDE